MRYLGGPAVFNECLVATEIFVESKLANRDTDWYAKGRYAHKTAEPASINGTLISTVDPLACRGACCARAKPQRPVDARNTSVDQRKMAGGTVMSCMALILSPAQWIPSCTPGRAIRPRPTAYSPATLEARSTQRRSADSLYESITPSARGQSAAVDRRSPYWESVTTSGSAGSPSRTGVGP